MHGLRCSLVESTGARQEYAAEGSRGNLIRAVVAFEDGVSPSPSPPTTQGVEDGRRIKTYHAGRSHIRI